VSAVFHCIIYSLKSEISASIATGARFIFSVSALTPAQSPTKSLLKDASTLHVLVLTILAVTCWLCTDCSFNGFLRKLQWALKSLSLKCRLRAEPLVPRAHMDHVASSKTRETVHIYRATQDAVRTRAEAILRTHLNTFGRHLHSEKRENDDLHLQLAKYSQQHG
jgi:hypothetical protein